MIGIMATNNANATTDYICIDHIFSNFIERKTVKGISNINYYGVKLRQERNWHMVNTQIEL